jgi:hypothetical protein
MWVVLDQSVESPLEQNRDFTKEEEMLPQDSSSSSGLRISSLLACPTDF